MLVRPAREPYGPAMTFWIVVGIVLVVLLAAMWRMDRNVRRRGSRVSTDIGQQVGRGDVRGNAEAYRGADTQGQRSGLGGGWS